MPLRIDPEQINAGLVTDYSPALDNLTLGSTVTLRDLIDQIDELFSDNPATLAADSIDDPAMFKDDVIEGAAIADGEITEDHLAFTLPSGFNAVTDPMPVGAIMPYAGNTAPTGWYLCDGSEVSEGDDPTLAAILGVAGASKWGTPAAGKFKLPDFRGKALIGAGTGSGLTARTLGDSGIGKETHVLADGEVPLHAHSVTAYYTNKFGKSPSKPMGIDGSQDGIKYGDTLTQNELTGQDYPYGVLTETTEKGSGDAHENMQPSAVCNFIIKRSPLAPQTAPQLMLPGDTATAVVAEPLFTWSTPPDAESYKFEISDTEGDYVGAELKHTEDGIVGGAYYYDGPALGTDTYYWRITPVNSQGEGPVSDEFEYTSA